MKNSIVGRFVLWYSCMNFTVLNRFALNVALCCLCNRPKRDTREKTVSYFRFDLSLYSKNITTTLQKNPQSKKPKMKDYL